MYKKRGQQFEGKEEYIKGIFNEIAPRYDMMNRVMTGGLVKKWRRIALELSDLRPGDKALDVGTGTGELAFLLADRAGPAGEVAGVDISEKMLNIAREKLHLKREKAGVRPQVSFITGDALNLPFPDDCFDCVMTGFALRNMSDIILAIREMVRVVKTGGRVVCLEISEPFNPLLRAGFKIYFYHFIPLLGRLVDRGRRISGRAPAYTWLAQSLREFPQGEELAALFREAGLEKVRYFPLSGGVVTVYAGVKKKG